MELPFLVVQAELLSLEEAADLLSQAVPVEHHDPVEAEARLWLVVQGVPRDLVVQEALVEPHDLAVLVELEHFHDPAVVGCCLVREEVGCCHDPAAAGCYLFLAVAGYCHDLVEAEYSPVQVPGAAALARLMHLEVQAVQLLPEAEAEEELLCQAAVEYCP